MKKSTIHLICYLFSLVAFFVCIISFFSSADPKIQSQAIYWFYTSLLCASLPYLITSVLPNMKYFKFKDLEIDLGRQFDNLTKSTEEQSLKVISNSLIELSGSDYISQLARIIKKEKKKQSNICIIYADIDGLKSHLADKENGRLLRVKALEFLNKNLEAGPIHFKKPYDIYSLSLRDPDSILIVRQITLSNGLELAEYVRSEFIKNSRGNEELELARDSFLTVSLSVVSSENLKETITNEVVTNLHSRALDLLDDAKNEGKNKVTH